MSGQPRLCWPRSRPPLLQAWASWGALWELRASPPPSRPSCTETHFPPRLGLEPHPWPRGCHSLQFSYCVPGGEPGCKLPGQEAATGSADDRDPRTPVGVPWLLGRWCLRLAPGWNTTPRPSRQKGSPGRCPVVTAVGPPGKPAHRSGTGPVDAASAAGPPCLLPSGQDARAWVGAPRAWTVDMGPLDVARPLDPSGLGTRREAGAWPTRPSCGPHPVSRHRVRKRQEGRAWAQGGPGHGGGGCVRPGAPLQSLRRGNGEDRTGRARPGMLCPGGDLGGCRLELCSWPTVGPGPGPVGGRIKSDPGPRAPSTIWACWPGTRPWGPPELTLPVS